MKKIILLALFVAGVLSISAQETYKYIIIPTKVPEFGNGIDPYGVSSSLQKTLADKTIKSVFESAERPVDYCQALTAEIVKESSLLKNKLSISFRDCMSRLIWSNEGTGKSKDFREGYAEAIEDALKDFNGLPAMKYNQPRFAETAPIMPVSSEVPAVLEKKEGEVYSPQNIYFNETYLVDYLSTASGDRKLIVLNGNSLGYDKMQEIATLTPSDLNGIYTVKFVQPNGEVWSGVASETGVELKISISSGDDRTVISLQKQ